MYVSNCVKFCTGGSFGHIHFVLAYCNETSQELSLGCVDVHVGIDIFKMAAIAMVTMKVFFLSDSNETSQE